MFRRIKNYLQLVVAEFKRVSWPTREDTTTSTILVLVLVAFFTLFLGVVDYGLSKAVQQLIN